jgi:hypothetical protein
LLINALSRPGIVSVYSSHIQNVDLLNRNTGRLLTMLRSKKWKLRIFYHLVDTSVINVWVLLMASV